MKKFEFRLQKVMRVREEIQKKREQDLAKAKTHVMKEQEKLQQLHDQDDACKRKIEESESKTSINPVQINHFYRYLNKLNSEMEVQQHRIDNTQKEMEVKRQSLIDASKDKKILEKLKEQKYSDYRMNLLRKEQNMLDDMVMIHHDR